MKYEQLKSQLTGPIFTVFTGFDDELRLDFQSIEKHIDFMAARGAKVFYVMPYNSRYSQLREREIFELNEAAIRSIKKHPDAIAIVSDCIHGPTTLSAEMGLAAKQAGADIFASIVREKYFSNEQIVDHYAYLSDQLNMPLLIHEMPFLSGYNSSNMTWPISLLHDLAEIEDIIAIKEDTKDIDYAIEALQLEPRFRFIFAGRKRYFNALKEHGLKAYLNSISMLDPAYGFTYWDLFTGGDAAALEHFTATLDDPFWEEVVKKYGWHRVNKAALEAAGFMSRSERLPLKALNDEQYTDVTAWIEKFNRDWKAYK
ncbi:dihydrodipicolinate synthase family protein [Aestuariibacter salexigens]|uniref:dihydrodipicolinate synthase family protein n=1 Tax=Aestuariibacter salexigens TaxID=226010 RepID=UPI00041A61C9|nr:dihydrodipicolinate synthase family protein [Aestuariibacter salexigens]